MSYEITITMTDGRRPLSVSLVRVWCRCLVGGGGPLVLCRRGPVLTAVCVQLLRCFGYT